MNEVFLLKKKWLFGFAILGGVSLAVYILMSALQLRGGFPLDDAWIHQSYARNLAIRGEWAFLPGQPSAGSTSPLWALILAIGYLVNITPWIWSALLGWITLFALAVLAVIGFRVFAPRYAHWGSLLAVGLLFEWHLVWAAGSGMETLLTGLIFTAVVVWLSTASIHWFWLGMLIGVGVWVRPDSLILLAPAGLGTLLNGDRRSVIAKNIAFLIVGFLILCLPYLLFNEQIGGSIWPNTFYAKQAEYQALQAIPFWKRYLSEVGLPMVGVGVILLPGFVNFILMTVKERNWKVLVGISWWFGYIGIYAWRLPVAYQHGRYIIPVMPLYLLWAAAGCAELIGSLIKKSETGRRTGAVLGKAWILTAVTLLVLFWGLGAQSFSQDVGFIETEMVDTARWISTRTQKDALVAAHDIGALGYFTGRSLVDLAGLVSPEVIPFIRDEGKLSAYMDAENVDFLVTFPGWYPEITRGLEPIFQTEGDISPVLGGENMAVYRWGQQEESLRP